MKFKKLIFLTLIGVLTLTLTACSNDDNSTSFEHDFPPADMSEYEIEANHRFYDVTMYEALQLLDDESFNGILYFGFPDCAWCQAAMPAIHEASQETNTDIFYVSRHGDLREGDWLNWDEEMAWWLYENGVTNMRWLNEDGELVDVGAEEDAYRPNINVPQIVHLRNGIVVDSHRGTFEDHDPVGEGDERHLPELTDAEYATLLETYIRIFSGIHACDINADDGCS